MPSYTGLHLPLDFFTFLPPLLTFLSHLANLTLFAGGMPASLSCRVVSCRVAPRRSGQARIGVNPP